MVYRPINMFQGSGYIGERFEEMVSKVGLKKRKANVPLGHTHML